MREILFRGKAVNLHNGSKDFVYGQYVQNRDGKMIYSDTWEDGIQKHYVIEETVGQYTGLTDKSGTKIFEGDILIYTDKDQDKSTHKVFWSDTRLAFYACYTRYPELYGYASNFNKDDIEVIGNIHDNPELLKGGSE